ncbi:25482_t:CDS:1, partial [Dentiscutata erythropus]
MSRVNIRCKATPQKRFHECSPRGVDDVKRLRELTVEEQFEDSF